MLQGSLFFLSFLLFLGGVGGLKLKFSTNPYLHIPFLFFWPTLGHSGHWGHPQSIRLKACT